MGADLMRGRWTYTYTPEGWLEQETNRLVPDWDDLNIMAVQLHGGAIFSGQGYPSRRRADQIFHLGTFRTDEAVTVTPVRPQRLQPEIVVMPEVPRPEDPHYEQLLADERIKNEELWQACLQLQQRIAELEQQQ